MRTKTYIVDNNHIDYEKCTRICSISYDVYCKSNTILRDYYIRNRVHITEYMFIKNFISTYKRQYLKKMHFKVVSAIVRAVYRKWRSVIGQKRNNKSPSDIRHMYECFMDGDYPLFSAPYISGECVNEEFVDGVKYFVPSLSKIFIPMDIDYNKLSSIIVLPNNGIFEVIITYDDVVVKHRGRMSVKFVDNIVDKITSNMYIKPIVKHIPYIERLAMMTPIDNPIRFDMDDDMFVAPMDMCFDEVSDMDWGNCDK